MTAMMSRAIEPEGTSRLRGLAALLCAVAHDLATHLVRREAIRTLHQLDDRALSDIGIARCHIEKAVKGQCP